MKVKIDEEACIGCNVCSALAPELFEIADDNKAHLIKQVTTEGEAEQVKDSAKNCPQEAIALEE